MVPHTPQCLLGLSQAALQTQVRKGHSGEKAISRTFINSRGCTRQVFYLTLRSSIFLLVYSLNTFDEK